MEVLVEFIKFLIYSLFIVIVSKYILVRVLRKFAEAINLKAKTVGNIAGVATSMPELLSVSFAAYAGLMAASVYNILSSNIINFIQYSFAIILNKNGKVLKNKGIQINLWLVVVTIIIPIILLITNIGTKVIMIPIFLVLFAIFYYLNTKVHKLYLKREDEIEEKTIETESKLIKGKKSIILRYSFYLLLTGIALFIIGNLLSNALENLCIQFQIPQFIMGIALGFITSLPELITFFESQKHHQEQSNDSLGVVEATNNLLASNVLNLFIIQSLGIAIYTLFN